MIDLNKLEAYPHKLKVAAGEHIAVSDPLKGIYIVLKGMFDEFITQGGNLARAGSYGPGASFGAREYFGEGGQSVMAAREASAVCVVTEATFALLTTLCPEAAFSILRDACTPPRAPQNVKAPAHTPGQVRMSTPAKTSVPNKVQAAKPVERPELRALAGSAGIVRDTGGMSVKVLSPQFFPDGHKGYPGIVKPEFGQFVYDKEYKCPNCYKMFKGKKIFETKLVSAGTPRYDLREAFVGFQTEWYDVITCPHCYFSMLSTAFIDPKNFVRVRVKDVVAGRRE